MKIMLGVLVLLMSGCGTMLPRSVPSADVIANAEEITNTPCAMTVQKKEGVTGTYVIIHSSQGYLGEEAK